MPACIMIARLTFLGIFAPSVVATTALAQGAPPNETATSHGPLMAFIDLIVTTYDRAPALVLGLAVLMALPPVALLGMALRRAPDPAERAEATRVYRRNGRGKLKEIADGSDGPLWPSDAWIELPDGARRTIGAGILRLGRDADNDVFFEDKTVHRYHAAIHRTDEAAYIITDLSSTGGNGVVVNGHRVQEAQLSDGDKIELGQTHLTFVSRPT